MHNALNKKRSNTSYSKLGRSFQRSERSSEKLNSEFQFNKSQEIKFGSEYGNKGVRTKDGDSISS